MPGFSQPERRGLERLQIARTEVHPDADLLTAFAEHSLSPREQELMLAHLAACASCREVVALAGSPLVEPVPEPVRKRAIWETPLFHWGAVAATLAVVIAAVSLGTREGRKSPTDAMLNETPSAVQTQSDKVVAEAPAKLDQDAAAANTPATTTKRAVHLQEQVRYERSASPAESKTNAPAVGGLVAGNAAPAPPPPAAGGIARDKVAGSAANQVADVFKDERIDLKQAPAAAPKVQQQTTPSADTAYAYKSDETLSITAQDGVAQMNSAAAPAANEAQAKKSMLAKSKEETARSRMVSPVGAFHQVQPIQSAITGTEWQITNLGQLQRSFNRGGLWENMLSDHTFRSVAVVRDHIWAGGDSGTLYFSSDNGRTWNQVHVQSGNASLTGNILRMRFADDTHGSIDTSSGETWNTSDGGQTWQKQ